MGYDVWVLQETTVGTVVAVFECEDDGFAALRRLEKNNIEAHLIPMYFGDTSKLDE